MCGVEILPFKDTPGFTQGYLGKTCHSSALQQLPDPFPAETEAGEEKRLSITGSNAGPAQLCVTGRQLEGMSCVMEGRAGEEDVRADALKLGKGR